MTKTYICDPARNTACGKALCFENGGPCGATDDVRCALRDLTGQPVEIVEEENANKSCYSGINYKTENYKNDRR